MSLASAVGADRRCARTTGWDAGVSHWMLDLCAFFCLCRYRLF